MPEPRFIIGFGERLTEPIPPIPGGRAPAAPYDLATARGRLSAQVSTAATRADRLPLAACPRDEVVTVVTLHPAYVAKSYFPNSLLQEIGLVPVGSRPSSIRPDAVTRRVRNDMGEVSVEIVRPDSERPTTELFVATNRRNLRRWAAHLSNASEQLGPEEQQLVQVEAVRLPSPTERLRLPDELPDEVPVEVVLHAGYGYVLEAFEAYAAEIDVDADVDRRIPAGGLCFVPATGPAERLPQLALFSYLRTIRAMPRLRRVLPPDTVLRRRAVTGVDLPTGGPIDSDLRVAVFDGGLPSGSCLETWVTAHELAGAADPVPEYLEHGQHVSSALLFGSIDPDLALPRPYSHVDHYRVLDADTERDPYELYDVITRIDSVLSQREYEFVSLSIGPDLPIEDDEVHSWTAYWDGRLADGQTLATVAVGNTGELDRASGNARVQVPSDCVNALAIGAASSRSDGWTRAPYSAVGPGRSPGVVKPDLVMFGGVGREPFVVVSEDKALDHTGGTSFASPSALRTAVGVRALFGDRVSPLALKALLVHTAERHDSLDRTECGWGRISEDLSAIVVCSDGVARVIYQGDLAPAKYLRAQLPLPANLPPCFVTLTATLAYATEVDPEEPGNYTRAGVEVFFRPHADKFDRPDSINAVTRPFFSKSQYATEAELRNDAHKWETVLHDRDRMRASSLKRPVFDIHYIAREGGHATGAAPKIRYAMVLTVSAPRVPSLYEDVLRTYATQLEALTPVLDIPIRVST